MCDVIPSIHPSSLYDLIDRSLGGLAAVIRLMFSSIHPSIHTLFDLMECGLACLL
jgi:hypothetical protein